MDLFRDEQGFPKNNMYKGLIFQAVVAGICLFFSFIFDGRMVKTEVLKIQEKVDQAVILSNEKPIVQHDYDSTDTVQTLRADLEITYCKRQEMVT